MTASATSTGAFRLSFLIARFSSTEESSLRQLLAQRAAGVQRGVIRRFAAGHALAHKADAGIIAVLFPAAHPLAVAPAVGAEQRGALAAKLRLTSSNMGWNSISSSTSLPMAGQPKRSRRKRSARWP